MICFHSDQQAGFIRIECDGFHSVEEIATSMHELRAEVARCRAYVRGVRVIVLCSPVVQSAEVVEAAARDRWDLPHPQDRLAMVVYSALGKMQVNRAIVGARERAFYSEDEAMRWLMHEAAPHGVAQSAKARA